MAADAVGLPEEECHAVLAAVEATAAGQAPEVLALFLGVRYRRLRRACMQGDAGMVIRWLRELLAQQGARAQG